MDSNVYNKNYIGNYNKSDVTSLMILNFTYQNKTLIKF